MSKGDKQSRGWMLTLPADEYDEQDVRDGLASHPFVGQREVGEDTGYEHWQLYVESSSAIRFSTLKRLFPKGHFEARQGKKSQAYAYVTKIETAVAGSRIESETKIDLTEPGKGKRSDLVELHRLITEEDRSVDELLLEIPAAARLVNNLREVELARDRASASTKLRDVQVEYWHGPTGIGKTRELWERYGADAYTVTDYSHPFDGYSGQRVLVLDEFRGQLPISFMLQLLDVYPVELPARYRNKLAAYELVFIVSNDPLDLAALYPRASAKTCAALRRRIGTVREFGAADDEMPAESGRGRHSTNAHRVVQAKSTSRRGRQRANAHRVVRNQRQVDPKTGIPVLFPSALDRRDSDEL